MKIILILIVALFSKFWLKTAACVFLLSNQSKSQNYTSGGNTGFNSWSVYQTNSPTNTYGNRYNCVNINRDSIVLRTKYIMMDSISNNNFPIVPGAKFAWLDGRQMKISKLDSLPLSARQITAGLGYVPSSGSTSINWTNILNTPTTLSGYGITDAYPLTGNPSSFIITETDPLFNSKFTAKSTTDLTEGTNLYFTAARTRTAVSAGSGLSYNSSTGTFSNTAQDQTITIAQGANVTVSGVYPAFTVAAITQTSALTSAQVTIALGATPLFVEVDGSISNEIQTLSGSNTNTITLSASGGSFVIPTQTVATTITGTNAVSVSGSYPNFTISALSQTAAPNATIVAGAAISTTTSGNSFTIANTTPDRTVTITAANPSIAVSGTYPNFTLTPYAPSTGTVTRAVNSTTFQPSSTKLAWVYYTIRINCVATIGGASSGTVALQYSTDNGSTWVDVGQVENSNTVTLAVVLNSSTTQTGQLSGVIPAGALVRMNSSSAGTTTITYVRGNETF